MTFSAATIKCICSAFIHLTIMYRNTHILPALWSYRWLHSMHTYVQLIREWCRCTSPSPSIVCDNDHIYTNRTRKTGMQGTYYLDWGIILAIKCHQLSVYEIRNYFTKKKKITHTSDISCLKSQVSNYATQHKYAQRRKMFRKNAHASEQECVYSMYRNSDYPRQVSKNTLGRQLKDILDTIEGCVAYPQLKT